MMSDAAGRARNRRSAKRTWRWTWLSVLVSLVSLVGCAKHVPLAAPAAPLTPPTRLCSANEGEPECRSATEVEALLSGPLEIIGLDGMPGGMQGAKLLTLRTHGRSGDSVLRAKWRSQTTEGLINEPRKELAAYAVQKLFLDETELVVPPTVAHCFAIAQYRTFESTARASFPGADCVFGFLSYWLEDAQTVGAAREHGLLGTGAGIWDARLFERDPEYRHSVSNGNLLTYLINHGDAHEDQFVLQSNPRGLRAFVVDNSIAFRSIKNPMLLLRQDWSQLQVPALSPKSIGRLQHLTDSDFERLGNVSELELREGVLVQTSPAEPLQSDGTTTSWHGSRLRIGLSQGEIELVAKRTRDLLSRPDLDQLTRR